MSSLIIISIKRKLRIIKIIEGVVLGLGAGLLTMGLLQLLKFEGILLPVIMGFCSMLLWLLVSGVFKITDTAVARYLSKSYPLVQNSTELLLLDSDSLNIVEQLQRQKVEDLVEELSVKLPIQWKIPFFSLVIGAAIYILTGMFPLTKADTKFTSEETLETEVSTQTILDPDIKSLRLKITPPSYSGEKLKLQKTPSIDALEGSIIDWEVVFNMPVDSARIVFSNGEKLNLDKESQFSTSYKAYFNDFYYVEMVRNGEVETTELYAIRISKDQAPGIDLHKREPFQEFEFGSISSTEVVATIKDDFGINTAKLIATVAKGSGESVKFREEVIPFETSFRKGIKEVNLSKTISLDSLNLEPGDELYFYVLASDNKLPTPNISKSETYFVALTDTTEIEFSLVGNLGVDLMPEYFRSQRQIIIDTEKLIKSKPKLSNYDFNFTSNELGFDQKVLRLKYGQFMGEEFVSDAGGGVEDIGNDAHQGEEDQMAEYTHAHDSENEHNLLEVNDKGEELGHNHDNSEENTYFSMSVRTKLKEAMTQMWDAELYLRLYQPKKSLPYQYKALKLIKEIKNHARIYVQRMGFDPPPIKPLESRLKGKALDEVVNSRAQNLFDNVDLFKETRTLLKEINNHFKTEQAIESYSWQNAGNELAPLAIEEPRKFFSVLNKIQQFRDGNVEDYDVELNELYRALINLIPTSNQSTNSNYVRSKWNKELSEQLKLEK